MLYFTAVTLTALTALAGVFLLMLVIWFEHPRIKAFAIRNFDEITAVVIPLLITTAFLVLWAGHWKDVKAEAEAKAKAQRIEARIDSAGHERVLRLQDWYYRLWLRDRHLHNRARYTREALSEPWAYPKDKDGRLILNPTFEQFIQHRAKGPRREGLLLLAPLFPVSWRRGKRKITACLTEGDASGGFYYRWITDDPGNMTDEELEIATRWAYEQAEIMWHEVGASMESAMDPMQEFYHWFRRSNEWPKQVYDRLTAEANYRERMHDALSHHHRPTQWCGGCLDPDCLPF